MASILIEPPSGEPLSLAEAKNYLRVSHDADDALIQSMISAARLQIEASTRRALLTQSWRIVLDRWPSSSAIRSPVSPLRELIAARVLDESGEAQELDTDIFIANTASSPGMIAFDAGRVVQPARLSAGIEIDIEAGYGLAADVPALRTTDVVCPAIAESSLAWQRASGRTPCRRRLAAHGRGARRVAEPAGSGKGVPRLTFVRTIL